ncbi:hypothetical protein HYV84_02700 [Candidatus Woesearchaeota archaeon]|nr:hypothetical protein [Candidatus Woesearchaeota archaeon]
MNRGDRLEEIIDAVNRSGKKLSDPFARHVNNRYGATALGLTRQELGPEASREIADQIHSNHLSPDASTAYPADIFFEKLRDPHEWVDGILYSLMLVYAGIRLRGHKLVEPNDTIFAAVGAFSLNPDVRPIGLEESFHLRAGKLLLSNGYILRNLEGANQNFSSCMRLWAELGEGNAILRRKTSDWYTSYLEGWLGPELAVVMKANDCQLTQAALQAYFLYKGNPLKFGVHDKCEANGSECCEYAVKWNPDERRLKKIVTAVLSAVPGIRGIIRENEDFRREMLRVELKVREYAGQVAELERKLGERMKVEEQHGLLAGLHHHLLNPLANILQYNGVIEALLQPGIPLETLAEQRGTMADCVAEIKKSTEDATRFLEITRELVGSTKPEQTFEVEASKYWGAAVSDKLADIKRKYEKVPVLTELESESRIIINNKLGLGVNNIWLNMLEEFERGNLISGLPIVIGTYDRGSKVQLSLISPTLLDWEKVYSAILHANIGLDREALQEMDRHRLLQYLKNPLVSTKGSTGNGLSFATASVLGLDGTMELHYDTQKGFETRIYLPRQG